MLYYVNAVKYYNPFSTAWYRLNSDMVLVLELLDYWSFVTKDICIHHLQLSHKSVGQCFWFVFVMF